MERFAQDSLLRELTHSLNLKNHKLKIFLILLVMVFCVLSLMRPQWGFHLRKVERVGLDILFAVDTSNSMLASDIKPSRLERSKLAISAFIKNLKGDRIGLIAFAGKSFLQCPLTVDYNGFLLSLTDLSTTTVAKGGTNLPSVIDVAIDTFKKTKSSKQSRVLIIISDGENHEGDPEEAAKLAKEEGIRIFTVGVGTPEGELIEIFDEEGKRTFLKDRDGNVVKSRLDEGTLQKVALLTGGSYVRATATNFGLDLLYDKKIAQMQKEVFKSEIRKDYEERFQIPLLIALLLLAIEPLISRRKR